MLINTSYNAKKNGQKIIKLAKVNFQVYSITQNKYIKINRCACYINYILTYMNCKDKCKFLNVSANYKPGMTGKRNRWERFESKEENV